jgi:transmembrane sensor
MPDQFEKIAQLLFKHISGELSADDRKELEAWIAEKEQNKAFFERITNEETLRKEFNDFTGADKAASWQAISAKIFPQRTIWWRYAAAAVALVLLSAGAFIFFNQSLNQAETATKGNASQNFKNLTPGGEKAILTLSNGSKIILDNVQNGLLVKQGSTKLVKQGEQLFYETAIAKNSAGEVFSNTVSIPRGGQYLLKLSDGTLVWLNSSSSIRFPATFTGTERTVELSGEAYFEVAHNPAMPFKVKKGDHEVQVLGTRFNVSAYDDENDIKVTLLQGAVQVMQHASKASQRLVPGQQAIMSSNGSIRVKDNVNAADFAAWKDGKYIFTEQPIEVIMRQIARWYHVEKIVYESPGAHLFTGVIDRKQPLAKWLAQMEQTQELDFEVSNDTIIVRPK